MGLDTVIVAFFVIEMILVVGGTITMGTGEVLESSYEGYAALHETTMNRLHTDIEIVSIWESDVTNHTTLKVQNTGETKLSDFELWDVILIEESQASYLIYNTDYKFFNNTEIINPGILDPHENIEIELLTFDSNDDVIIKIITENGISSSAEYNGPE